MTSESERFPGERNGYPLQYSCLGNSMDRGMSFTFMFTHSISQGMPKIASKSPSSVQTLGCVRLSVTPWTTARQASLSITNSWSLLKLMSIESVMPSNRLILCCPLLLLPSIFPSIRVFSNESVGQSIGVSASASALPMNNQD